MEELKIVAVVMAGGGGTRFWPKSRRTTPKQFLAFEGSDSLLKHTLERLKGLVPREQTLIITNERHAALALQQTGLPEECVVGEPCQRDTAACIGLGALLARGLVEDAVMAVLPADHMIGPVERFQGVLRRAAALASSSDSLVTIGLRPHRPATGYGYIETGEAVDQEQPVARKVVRFREKPDLETARRFVLAGRFLWNSGILVCRTETMLTALQEHLPLLHAALTAIKDPTDAAQVASAYRDLPKISIDFGVLEPARNKVVVEADFHWDDVGTFEAIARHLKPDQDGNLARGEAAFVESRGNLVDNAAKGLVVVHGLNDILVVRTADAVLVIPRKEAERVKEVVRHLQELGQDEYL